MKRFIFTILLLAVIASPNILELSMTEGIEIYGPDYLESVETFTGPCAQEIKGEK